MFGSKKKKEEAKKLQAAKIGANSKPVKKASAEAIAPEKIKVLTAEELKNGEKPKKITDAEAELMARALKTLLKDK